MHELYCIKVPETLDFITYIAPITIMTRSPVAATTKPLSIPSSLAWLRWYKASIWASVGSGTLGSSLCGSSTTSLGLRQDKEYAFNSSSAAGTECWQNSSLKVFENIS